MVHNFRNLVVAAFAASELRKVAGADSCTAIEAALGALVDTPCGQAYVGSRCGNNESDNNNDKNTDPALPDTPVVGDEPFIGTYYPNWMVYSKLVMGVNMIGRTNPGQLDPTVTVWPSDVPGVVSKVNAIYYAFLNLDENCFITDMDPGASWYGEDGNSAVWIKMESHPNACKGAMNDLLSLKTEYPHLRLLASVGGWTYSKNFSKCLKSEEGMKKMYDSFSFYTGGDFGKSGSLWAGIDWDWEHPGAAGYTEDFDAAVDWPNYAKLVNYFKGRAQREGHTEYMQTSAVGVGDTLDLLMKDRGSASSFCDGIDHINLMTYDMHGKWEPVTGHNSPFCQIDSGENVRPAPRTLPWSVVDRVNAMVDLCGANKVAVGIPNYSPAWTDIPSSNDGLYQTSTNSNNWATWSTFSDDAYKIVSQGILHWWDLKAAVANSSNGLKVFSKKCPAAEGVEVPVKWVYSEAKKIFACYEDEETVQKKAEWARKKGLAGFFFWDMSQDKTGDLLNAARQGWGMDAVGHPSTGTKMCQDSRRPDFSLRPDGSMSPYAGCHKTKRSVTVLPGNGCASVASTANAACNGKKAIAVGGNHPGQTQCTNPCTESWANGKELWANDVVYYVCDGESLEDGGSSNEQSEGQNENGSGGGKVCYTPNGWYKTTCVVCNNNKVNSHFACDEYNNSPCYITMEECDARKP